MKKTSHRGTGDTGEEEDQEFYHERHVLVHEQIRTEEKRKTKRKKTTEATEGHGGRASHRGHRGHRGRKKKIDHERHEQERTTRTEEEDLSQRCKDRRGRIEPSVRGRRKLIMNHMNLIKDDCYRWYQRACETFNYPAGPYGSLIKTLVTESDTVLDLGCGIGAASIMVSQWCKQVIALDKDKDALACLAAHCREDNITNIVIKNDAWPPAAPVRADIVVALHVPQVTRASANLKLIFESVNRGGFIACRAPVSRPDEPFLELKEELGKIGRAHV